MNGSFGLQSCFPLFVTSQIVNPAYRNSTGVQVGRTLVELCTFQNQNLCWCFYITVFLMETNCFQINLYVIFISSFILSDKATFVSGALICVQCYRGNLARYNSASRWQRINLRIYVATNGVSLWDYGINKFNCITVSVQIML